jgi:class 3 adenylate cyclase/predicted ATPase
MQEREVWKSGASDARRCARCAVIAHAGTNFCSQCGWMLSRGAAELSSEENAAADRRHQTRFQTPFERRQLTVMFCDLVNSTSLALRADPEDLNDAFGDFYAAVTDSVSEFGGFVARYVGDGALVYFGYPSAHEDDAERAIQAALATLARVKEQGRSGRAMRARIGIATGVVVVGNLHAETLPTTLDIAGEPAHVAARLQASARPDTILVAASTRAVIGELFEWRSLGPRRLKGIADPVDVWEVLGTKAVSSRFEALRGSTVSPMLARDGEHATLLAAWQAVSNGHGNAVLVHGEPGIGKSRLAASIADDATKSHGAILRFSCSPTRQGSAFHPCIVFLENAAGFARTDSDEAKLAKLAGALVDASLEDVSLIADLLSLKHEAPPSLASLTPRARRQRTMQVLISQLERAAKAQPVLIVFEDAHWCDESSRVLLDRLVDRLEKLPILLLVLARPEFQPAWRAHRQVKAIELDPLTPEVSAALVHFTAGDHPLSPRIVADIVARTDGLPLFIEEVTKAIVEGDKGGVTPTRSARDNDLLPFSLQASLLARLDRLGRAREIAQVAAAIGREFSGDLLRLVGDSDGDIDHLLDTLVASGILLRSTGSASNYIFKHALIRDAAHAIMNRDKRHAVHTRIAAALEAHYPEVALNNAEVLAWHYTEARVIEKAVGYWLRAGHHCLRRSAMDEALGHLRRGESLIAQVPDTPWRRQCELDLTIAMGMAQIATQGYAVASTGDTFRKAQVLCERLPDPPQTLAVMHGLWTHALMRADFPSALKQVEEVLDRGATRSDPIWSLMGHRFRGCTRYFLGEFSESIADIDAGLALYDPALRARYATLTVDDPRIVMLLFRAWSLMCMGRFADAKHFADMAVHDARKIGHLYSLAHALSGRAFITLSTGSPSDALRQVDELSEALADNGIAYYDAIATIMRGYCLVTLNRVQQGLPLITSGLAAYRGAGTVLYASGFLRMAAECHCRAGMTTEAMAMIDEAVTVMDATWQCWDAAEIHRVRGTVLLATHNETEAEESLRRSLDIARSQGAMLWELRAARDLAGLLSRRGASDEGGYLLKELASSHRHGTQADVERAREILFAN